MKDDIQGVLELYPQGQMASPKRMNFRKSSKPPLTPSPSFPENHVANLYPFHAQEALFKRPKYAIYFFGLEMTPLPLDIFR